MREYRKIPTNRVLQRCRLEEYRTPILDRGKEVEPERVEILMKQHIGASAMPTVSKGDSVRRGDLVGEIPENSLGARQHASISGTVIVAEDERIIISASPRVGSVE